MVSKGKMLSYNANSPDSCGNLNQASSSCLKLDVYKLLSTEQLFFCFFLPNYYVTHIGYSCLVDSPLLLFHLFIKQVSH